MKKLQEINPTIVFYPWKDCNQHSDHPPIDQPDTIAVSLSQLQVYVPGRQSAPTNQMQHYQLFLRMSLLAHQLLEQICPWLHATHQGLWPHPIAMAEKTVCLGWLLYSAPEYNREAISQAIYKATGVTVALRLRKINQGKSWRVPTLATPILALHLEVDSREQRRSRKKIATIYTIHSKEFPLGIRMRLVPELHTLNNPATRMQVTELQHRQRQFLAQTETYQLAVPTSALAANEYVDINRLREIILTTSHPAQSAKDLFMAVSFRATTYTFLIRYKTQQRTNAQAAIYRLSDTLGWVCGNALQAQNPAARIKLMKAIASHNHRATQIHCKTQSTSTKVTTTYMNQL